MSVYFRYVAGLLILILAIVPVMGQESEAVTVDPYPEPNVIPLIPDENVLYDRIYRRETNPLTIYDAPGGNITNDYGVGYNFVTLSSLPQGDWAEIGANRWISTAGLTEDVTTT